MSVNRVKIRPLKISSECVSGPWRGQKLIPTYYDFVIWLLMPVYLLFGFSIYFRTRRETIANRYYCFALCLGWMNFSLGFTCFCAQPLDAIIGDMIISAVMSLTEVLFASKLFRPETQVGHLVECPDRLPPTP